MSDERAKQAAMKWANLHPDAKEIMQMMRTLGVNIADSDWYQLVDFTDAAVRHAASRYYPEPSAELARLTEERDRLKASRKHTQDWYASHYGKVEDWARRRLPEPWSTEYFSCIANGTWGHDDVGEPYMSQVGRIVPSGYVKFDTAQEQILHDQSERAESAESTIRELKHTLDGAEDTLGYFMQWAPDTPKTREFNKKAIGLVKGWRAALESLAQKEKAGHRE